MEASTPIEMLDDDATLLSTPKAARTWGGLKITQFRSRRASTPEPHPSATAPTTAYHVKDCKPDVVALLRRALDEKDAVLAMQAVTTHPKLVASPLQDDTVLLHHLCQWPHIEATLELLQHCVHEYPEGVAYMDKRGRTPLHYLCMNGSVTVRAIQVLVVAFPVSAAMCDKASCLPVHYLCLNSSQTIDMTMMLHNYETFSLRNHDGRTPLHCVLSRPDCEFELCATVLSLAPETTSVVDSMGRTILHMVAAHPTHIESQLLQLLLSLDVTAAQHSDMHGQLPLHRAVANPNVNVAALRQLLHAFPGAVDVVDGHGQSPLHLLCGNEALAMDLLLDYAAVATTLPTSLLWLDDEASTSLHIACMNPSSSPEMIRVIYDLQPDAATALDKYECTPFHYACSHPSISVDLVWLFLDHARALTSVVDHRGKTPLHYLAANRHVSVDMISIVFDADPSASQVTDHAMKLPVHYLIENPSIPSAHAYRLLAGGASYRQRYRIHDRAVTEFATTSFAHGPHGAPDVLFSAIDEAIDGSDDVRLQYCSSSAIHRHLIALYTALQATPAPDGVAVPALRDTFENARRRIRLPSGASMTLEFGLVTLTPRAAVAESSAVDPRRLLVSMAAVLLHWHDVAQVVHGNICPATVVHSHIDDAHMLYPAPPSVRIGQAMATWLVFPTQNALYCAPEMAAAYLRGETPMPTPATDMWQLGCTIYHVATGTTLLEAIAPHAALCTPDQVYHLLLSINESVLERVVQRIGCHDVQRLVKHLLEISPSARWTARGLVEATARVAEVALPPNEPGEARADAPEPLDPAVLLVQRLRDDVQVQTHATLEAKTRLRRVELDRNHLRLQLSELVDRLNAILLEKEEAIQQVAVMTKKRASLTQQLDTMAHMLISVMPLAQKVYGAMGDDLLARLMSHAAMGTPPESALYALPASTSLNRMLRDRIRDTMLARGCVGQWANAPPPLDSDASSSFFQHVDDDAKSIETNP
ncbi:hypothetical protein SPRG_00968 [Saprolegnia parasitica CBS 223.65]|uniref:Protein kinase domain-containing protein n=1 Tax=Saprolegnia parasitica (strain CBS 223.65) TaxID=695850 RepID=A0A067CWL9_SAPPC|nr:hypothetical protein SPRG_00968 [Saprolegnia parasitica CBS 223.65]KDO34908.1 hypothetical protein SPRG_00968 [Saprolegnia parasitica CBS 223.65]|eukprot:XP_012194566.1 hypothetical protein SPRG_00968 [Saprolegnia parasitica CBS 223.65]